MTRDELKRLYDEWEDSKDPDVHDPVESSDNYYWAGSASFRNFLEKKLGQ